MRERIFGTESEYALYYNPEDRKKSRLLEGESFPEFLKGLSALLMASLAKKNIPHAGEFLGNGGRFYIDRGSHPEYATPECRNVYDLVAHEKAGDMLVRELVAETREKIAEKTGVPQRFRVYKNNVDNFGNTYGGHENYLITAKGMERIDGIIPFLVTRQIFTGSGKPSVGNNPEKIPYQISQRADFFNKVFSDRTAEARGIINTRRRELPRLGENRRLHIICGDCNLSEYAIAIKIGVTALVVRLLEEGALEKFPVLAEPVRAMRQVSSHFNIPLPLAENKGRCSALDIQFIYLEKAHDFFSANPPSEEESLFLDLWEKTLAGLKKMVYLPEKGEISDVPDFILRKIDWVFKLWLLNRSRENQKIAWGERRLAALDYQYHDLDTRSGLYERCLSMGLLDRFVDDNAIETALKVPPSNTRARIRGEVIVRAMGKPVDVHIENWEHVSLRADPQNGRPVHPFIRNQRIMNALELELQDPFCYKNMEAMEKVKKFLRMWEREPR